MHASASNFNDSCMLSHHGSRIIACYRIMTRMRGIRIRNAMEKLRGEKSLLSTFVAVWRPRAIPRW